VDILRGLLLFAACLFAAYKVIKWLWPIIEQRKDLTAIDMVERAIMAPGEEMEREATAFGSIHKTQVVGLVNLVLVCAWAGLSMRFPWVFWCGVGYQCIGHTVITAMRIQITPAPDTLKFHQRVWLRMFYAWFWPIYLAYGRK
jgi:hypothetical protein